ncbi:mgpp2cl-1, protein phosphatase 2C-like protein 1 [Balamuthia mandrillaris]
MAKRLPYPLTNKCLERYGDARVRVGVASMQGYRTNMEDEHAVALENKNHPRTSFFAVFDGHANLEAAQYCSQHLIPMINDSLSTVTRNGLKQSFVELDKKILEFNVGGGSTAVLAMLEDMDVEAELQEQNEEKEECARWLEGECAEEGCPFVHSYDKNFLQSEGKVDVRAWKLQHGLSQQHEQRSAKEAANTSKKKLGKYKLTIANVGDSRAVLHCRSDATFVPLTLDHVPTIPQEKKRIEHAGGTVRRARVDRSLAMSRALGDARYKQEDGLSLVEQRVSPLPDITVIDADEGDSLLLACDGIFENLSTKDVMSFLDKELQRDKSDPADICSKLLDYALQAGSNDNMTAMLVLLQDGTHYHSPDKQEYRIADRNACQDPLYQEAYLADLNRLGLSMSEVEQAALRRR